MPVPPGPGLRRMFAGGRVQRHGALTVGAEATRRTWQASAAVKQGRTGPLHFVTVRTEISQGGAVVVSEEQDRVTGSLLRARGRIRSPLARWSPGPHDWMVAVDPVLLFRHSVLM